MKEISIEQLTNEVQFLKLKKDFLQSDEEFLWHLKNMNEGDPEPEVNYDLDEISYMNEGFTDLSDEFGVSYYESNGSFEEIKKNFYVDYLHPMIKNMPNYYIRQLDIKFIKKDILNAKNFKRFGNSMTDRLNNKLKDIENSTHLNIQTRDLIKLVFSEIINDIYVKYIQDPVDEKIHFNLNKNQVVILLNLLHDNKVISATPALHFNEMIQKFFRYKSGNGFKEIDKAYKVYDELLGLNPKKPSLPTLNELKKIFSQPDFFNPVVK